MVLYLHLLPRLILPIASAWLPGLADTGPRRERLKPDPASLNDPTSTVSLENANASPIRLSDEQNKVLKRVKEGHSVFFTGSAGKFLFDWDIYCSTHELTTITFAYRDRKIDFAA